MALKDLLFSNVDDVKPSDLLVLIKSKDDKYLAVKLDTESDMDFTEVLTKLEKVFPKSKGFTAKSVNLNVLKEVAPKAEIVDFKDLDEDKEYFSEEPVVTTEGDEANSDAEKPSEPETDNGKLETTLHSNMNLEDILFSAEELGETNDLRTLLFDESETRDDSAESTSDDQSDVVEQSDEFKDEVKPADTTPSSKVKIEVEVPQDPAAGNENKALEKVKQIVETFHSAVAEGSEVACVDCNNAEAILEKVKEVLKEEGEATPLGTTTEVVEDPKPEVPASPEVAPEDPTQPESPEVVVDEEEYKSPVELVKEANENKDTDSLELHCRQTNKRKF
jgi:hypothetical protein